jgi:sterol-4alpha-carboxylate 3-dehydrogenase (decarboxylating)
MDETTPYPKHHPNAYCRSKAEAEKLVRSADGNGLRTICLRPADIYGEGDPFHIGSLIEMAEKGFYVRIGDGSSKCCHVYVGNVAAAHIQAATALANGRLSLGGNVYLITDAPPSNFFSFFDYILLEAGYRLQPPNVWLPQWLMYIGGCIAEFAALLIRPFIRKNPRLSRFAVTYTCSDIVFSSVKAKEDFNFTPKYSQDEALRRTVAYYALHRKDGCITSKSNS